MTHVCAGRRAKTWYNYRHEVAARDNFVILFALRPQTVLLPLFAGVLR